MGPVRTLTPRVARRLAIAKQRLAGPDGARASAASANGAAGREAILSATRSLGCLQLDPTNAVARSHLLVLWSRLGQYQVADLDTLLWQDRALFEYWAHAASIVLTEDYPIHNLLMRRYPTVRFAHSRRMREWVVENDALRRHVLQRLRKDGPLRLRDFEDRARTGWQSSGWTSDRNVERMLDYLWTKGQIMVAGRPSGQKLWDLAERCLPDWTPRQRLREDEVVRRSVERSVRALGVAQPGHIQEHFTPGRYAGLPGALAGLQRAGVLHPVRVADGEQVLPGPWFVHRDDVPLLERLQAGEWEPRTTLLSPFDNLICDRSRTELVFGFHFRMEIYVPKTDRKFGYYVLPILHGDRLIGRVDPMMDRAAGRLEIKAVHAEPGAPVTAAAGRAVRAAVDDLATFLGAADVAFTGPVPEGWSKALR